MAWRLEMTVTQLKIDVNRGAGKLRRKGRTVEEDKLVELESPKKPKPVHSAVGRYHSDGSRREQELCVDALMSGEYDALSDDEWVELCEQVAREAGESDLPAADEDD